MSDKNLLANSIGFRLPLFCFGHSVARSPFVLASVVRIFSLSELQCARQSNCVISLFIFLNTFVCSSVKTHSIRCSSSFLVLSVRADRFSIYFDKYCMAPKKDFYTFSFFGMFIFVISSTLSRSGMIPFWSILCPTQSASFLKSSNFPGVVCSLLPSISSSFLFFSFALLPCYLCLLLKYEYIIMRGVCTQVFYLSVPGKLLVHLPVRKSPSGIGGTR